MSSEKVLLPVCLALLSVACATTLPAPLVSAHLSYDSSAKGPASQLASHYLQDARKALDKADTEFTANGDTDVCRDYAYIAENKLELADAVARTQLMSSVDLRTETAQTETWTPTGHLIASAR